MFRQHPSPQEQIQRLDTRLRELEARLQELESWKEQVVRRIPRLQDPISVKAGSQNELYARLYKRHAERHLIRQDHKPDYSLLDRTDFTIRYKKMEQVATSLRKVRDTIKLALAVIHPDGALARVKFRGSLVRGIKAYHKGTYGKVEKFDPKNFDCDAFIEIPDILWERLIKGGIKRHKIEIGKPSEKTVYVTETRKYESTLSLAKVQPDTATAKKWQNTLNMIRACENRVKNDLAKIEGYRKNDDNTVDFEFYLRPVSNIYDVYDEGNPYLLGQLPGNYPVGIVEEFTRKLDDEANQERAKLLSEYAKTYGTVGTIVPDFQVVIGKHCWYVEDAILFAHSMAKRKMAKLLGKSPSTPKTVELAKRNIIIAGKYAEDDSMEE